MYILNQIDYFEFFKIFFLSLFTYYTDYKISGKNKIYNKLHNIIILNGASVITGIIRCRISYLSSIIILILLISIIYDIDNIKRGIITTIISLNINYIIIFLITSIYYIPNRVLSINNQWINLFVVELSCFFFIKCFFRIKKMKYGFSFLKKSQINMYADLLVLNISTIIIFLIVLLENTKEVKYDVIGFSVFFVGCISLIILKKSIEAYYKQKLLIQDLNETKKELEEKKKEVEELEAENLNFSKKSHSLAHKQKSLEFKINKLLMNLENANELGLEDDLKNLSKELYENSKLPELEKTGITEIDDMFSVMQEECRLNGIDLSLQLKGNIYQMTNNFITKEELSILLADHIKDAIIAINHTDNINKSIMVRLGKIDENFCLYIYDSGVEFPKEVLENLGKRPITTYSEEGGTGMGFMNTFDTLKKYNASLIIESIGKPSKDNYTKVIKIIFDNKYQKIYE